MKRLKSIYLLFILMIWSAGSNLAQNPKWEKVAPGVWKTSLGTPDEYNLLKAAGSTPLLSGLDKMSQPGFPLSLDKITFSINEGQVALRFPLQKEEQIFGFGLNFQTIFQRGKVLELHVDHYGGKDNGRTHAPVPFYVSDLRMALMPYFYSEFARYHFEGTPPFRAMYLEPGFSIRRAEQSGSADLNENPYAEAVRKEIKDQYMAGGNLLVAPMFIGQTSRKVVLPEGKWFDFYTGKLAGEGEVITVEPGLAIIPVFVKDGALIPMMKPRLRAPKAGETIDLEIRHYGTKDGIYRLYDDDGETFDYEKGAFSWRELKFEGLPNGKFKTGISRAEPGKPDNLGKISWIMMPGAEETENSN